jgi:cysteine desulfurase
MSPRRIYLDYNATTPIRRQVKAALIADLEIYGKRLQHARGRPDRGNRVEKARGPALISSARRARPIVFTSGGSESNNTVFQTMLLRGEGKVRNEIITTAIEHPCVINSAEFLRSRGIKVTFSPWTEMAGSTWTSSPRP